MPNGDPRDGFFYPTLTLMMDSYNIWLSLNHNNSVHEYFPDITRHSVWCSHEFYQTKQYFTGPKRKRTSLMVILEFIFNLSLEDADVYALLENSRMLIKLLSIS